MNVPPSFQAEGLPGLVRQRPELVQEEGADRIDLHPTVRIKFPETHGNTHTGEKPTNNPDD